MTIGAASAVGSRYRLVPFEPAYRVLHRSGVLAERVTAGLREPEDCGSGPATAADSPAATPAVTLPPT